VVQTAQGERSHQPRLEEGEAPERVEVDARRLWVERVRVMGQFGEEWRIGRSTR
jgi:hypothetical protein